MIVRSVLRKPLISIVRLADDTLSHVTRPPSYYNNLDAIIE